MLFAGLILIILWLLQVLFLNNYYQQMKIRETTNVAANIENLYKAGDLSEIRAEITSIYRRNDMYIEVQTESGLPIFIPNINIDGNTSNSTDGGVSNNTSTNSPDFTGNLKNTNSTKNTDNSGNSADNSETSDEPKEEEKPSTPTTPHLPPTVYQAEIGNLKAELLASSASSISKKVTDPNTGLITLQYAAFLTKDEDRNLLFIFSPLYPMESTIEIFSSQLIYITIIAIILAFMISLYLSRKITQPLSNITESALRLGEGEYGIVFEGAHYTEIIDLADTLSYTSLELAKTDNMQKDIIANVSHDLRTPLTMVISYAEMIRDLSGDDPEKRNAHLQVIIDEADRLNKLVGDLLEVSRMQSGDREINLSEFSLKNTIETFLQSYTGYVEQEGYKLVFISRGDGVISGDEDRIKQVIANLVSNAFKYCGRDKTVEVKMFEETTYVRCEVSDHGMGIPKKDLRHIWERYYKASSNYQRSGSTGLGLSIVKEILSLHGANFGVESALKKGSTFWFEIAKPVPAEAPSEGIGTAHPEEDSRPENEQSQK